MSRSSTHYRNLCHHWGDIGEDGFCDFHRPYGSWNRAQSECVPSGSFETRRGVVERGPRFPDWSVKSWHRPPPLSMKKVWRRWIRSKYAAEMRKNPDDPELFGYNKALANRLWDWY